MISALEKERNHIIAHIHASRETYRHILATNKDQQEKLPVEFPRSRSFRWIKNHPVITASGITILFWLVTKRLSRYGHTKVRTKHQARKDLVKINPVKTLYTIGTLLLQNPSRLQTAGRIAGIILKFLKK